MTEERQKAIELTSVYLKLNFNTKESKACALVTINEIISACEYNRVDQYNTAWWNKVRLEIESL